MTGTVPARPAVQPPRGLPEPAIVRGASRGFTVLLLGGAVQPLVAVLAAPVGYVWLALVAVAAFALSAWTVTEEAGTTLAQSVAAAMGAYLLITPVVVMLTGALDPVQVLGTSVTALVVAGLVHLLRGRR